MASVTRFLERKLRLCVNAAKSAVARVGQRTFLGMRVLGRQQPFLGIAPASLTRFKETVRRITQGSRGVSLAQLLEELNQYTRGWVHYFALAEAKRVLHELDKWTRRRLPCFIWKQWKSKAARVRHLRRAGVGPWLATALAGRTYGPWRVARHAAMQRAAPTQVLKEQGYQSFYERYLRLHTA